MWGRTEFIANKKDDEIIDKTDESIFFEKSLSSYIVKKDKRPLPNIDINSNNYNEIKDDRRDKKES